jgi:hypothetical protein
MGRNKGVIVHEPLCNSGAPNLRPRLLGQFAYTEGTPQHKNTRGEATRTRTIIHINAWVRSRSGALYPYHDEGVERDSKYGTTYSTSLHGC